MSRKMRVNKGEPYSYEVARRRLMQMIARGRQIAPKLYHRNIDENKADIDNWARWLTQFQRWYDSSWVMQSIMAGMANPPPFGPWITSGPEMGVPVFKGRTIWHSEKDMRREAVWVDGEEVELLPMIQETDPYAIEEGEES